MSESVGWKDCKRHFGLPISFTKYEVSDGRLLLKTGFIKTQLDELMLYRITDIRLTVGLGQRLFGVGTVTLYSADKTDNVITLKNIKKPGEIRKLLSKLVEAERIEKGLVGRELYGIAQDSGSDNV